MGDDGFVALLDNLAARGVDLRAFDAAAQRQAVARRMRELGVTELDAYRAVVCADDDEPGRLAERALIGFTAFLREPAAWRALARHAVAGLASPLRAWSAGCGTGEEAYTVAIVLAEAFRAAPEGIDVVASDIDADALAAAARGRYPAGALRGVPLRWRRRYFRRVGCEFEVIEPVRERVTVVQHDLVSDPPPPRLDLVVCRHTLMYFHPTVQRRILNGFAGALRDGGLLLCERTDLIDGAAWARVAAGLYQRRSLEDGRVWA